MFSFIQSLTTVRSLLFAAAISIILLCYLTTTFIYRPAPVNPVDISEKAPHHSWVPLSADTSTLRPISPGDDTEYLALCVPVHNNPSLIPEFLTHHYHHIGIRRFY